MKEFLLVLFYQAIVAANTAVIISGIVWLAKRKDEKDGRKPNPDFTPPPEKKPEVELRSALIKTVNGEKIAQRWYSPDEQIPQYAILQGEPYKFLAEMDKDGGKLVEFVRIKPPTTGTNAITPKDGEKYRRPYMTTAIVRGENGKLTIPIAETGVPVAGFGWRGEDRIFGYVQTLGRTTTPDAGAPWDIDPETGEVKDYQTVNGKEYRVYYWTKKEDAQCIRTPPITGEFFNCKHWKKETCSSIGKCDVLDRPTKWYERSCQLFEKWEPPVQTTRICGSCKHFLATGEEATVGECGLNDEIMFKDETRACFEPKPGKNIVRPKPLGAKTTH